MKGNMRRGERPELMWGLGLTEAQKEQIENAVGPGFFLRNFPEGKLPWNKELNQAERPSATWIPMKVWKQISDNRKDEYKRLEETQRILIQDEQDEPVEMEQVLEQGFLTVVTSPLTRRKVQDAVFRAKEVTSMYSDIYRMTEEIMLERELLARKTDQLLFLNRILTVCTESLDPAIILANAKENLNMLLPVYEMHAVFWHHHEATGFTDVEMFLDRKADAKQENEWVETLMDCAERMGGGAIGGFQMTHIDPLNRPAMGTAERHGRVVTMPLSAGNAHFGSLVLTVDSEVRMGKDEVETFKAAASHLGLALRNALTFKEVKLRADHDALTRIYNRHTFDDRLVYELKRRQRYGHELSLLMVDLDHFKGVNDTYGHKAGDMVLKEMGTILRKALRSTDLAARYGGEEFVVLLPHTTEKDAHMLAERIRSRVEATVFSSEGVQFSVTASIGVASIESGCLSRDEDLLLKADKALYEAKNNGRNMVVVSKIHETVQQARQ
ncbi:GGDEF domain-containing protein [Salidesulfovibrio onnuriiensis]|uniref:GGDEF domain-containing protein n=1 Tax=Salidesulfovibrio onnuriiensis TaxID=2583823 RepID=UPI00202AE43A|nr:GGDEF domain-containing protein [Salidesulfovibrio onnuriiensis]